MDENDIIDFVKSCQTESGGCGPSPRHDPSILYTLSAIQVGIVKCFCVGLFVLKTCCVQILCIYDRLDAVDVDAAVNYIAGLQNEDGSFSGISVILLKNVFLLLVV